MNLSLVLWQVWMQLVMYRWMNSEGRSTAWGEGVGGASLQASTQTQFMFTNTCTIAMQRVLVETYTPEQAVTQVHTGTHTCFQVACNDAVVVVAYRSEAVDNFH